MSYKIIIDSCGELTDEMRASGKFKNVPLTLQVGDTHIVDDETFDQAAFLDLIASTTACPKSACPSPEEYMNAFDCDIDDRVYVITLSSQLSGSHNSAYLAQKLYAETNPYAKVAVIDSKSASAGQTLIGMKIQELEEQGLPFEEIVEKANAYRDSLMTIFVLEDLSFLERNGRLTGVKKLAANLLHIVPIMGSTDEGTIFQIAQVRGIKKALVRLYDEVLEYCKKTNPEKMVIAHCNCVERAEDLKNKILEVRPDMKIYINNTRGVASLYSGNKGIICAF